MNVRFHRDEQGMTLVELLVVIVVLGIVGTIALTGIVNGIRTTTRGQDRIEALTDLETGVERIGRELRATCQIDTFEPDDVSLRVVRGGEVYRYRYVLGSVLGGGSEPDALYEVRSVHDASTGGFVLLGTRLFITDLANTELFGFFERDGSSASVATNISTAEILLQRRLPDQSPIEVRTSVHLRNHGGFTCAT